jgi:hypothetical protein
MEAAVPVPVQSELSSILPNSFLAHLLCKERLKQMKWKMQLTENGTLGISQSTALGKFSSGTEMQVPSYAVGHINDATDEG